MRTESRTESISANTVRKALLPNGARELIIRDTSLRGFALRVYRGGSRYVFSGRIKGTDRRRNVTIGDALAMTAREARTAAEALRIQFGQGIDPVALKEQKQIEKAARITLEELAEDYTGRFTKGALPHQRRVPTEESIRSERKDVARAVRLIGPDKLVDEISASDLSQMLDAMDDVSPSTRKKTFGCVNRILNRAVTQGIIEMNPAAQVPSPVGSLARERFLSEAELAKVWDAAGKLGVYGRLVRFLIAMPVRTSIARDMTFDAVDRDAGTLAVSATQRGNKARRAWTLPLPALALDCIGKTLRQPFVFRSTEGGQVALSSSAKARLDKASGVSGWQLHDLRRTAVTLLAEALDEVDVDACDQWLMHKRTGIEGVYQRSQRLRGMHRVADQWNGVLSRITGGAQANVVRLHR